MRQATCILSFCRISKYSYLLFLKNPSFPLSRSMLLKIRVSDSSKKPRRVVRCQQFNNASINIFLRANCFCKVRNWHTNLKFVRKIFFWCTIFLHGKCTWFLNNTTSGYWFSINQSHFSKPLNVST